MKRQIGQIGRARQQVALLDMLDMSWYNGCPPWGAPGPFGPRCPKIALLRWDQKITGPLRQFQKIAGIYIKISLYDGVQKSPGICLYDRLQKCRGLYDSHKNRRVHFKTIRHKTYRYIDIGQDTTSQPIFVSFNTLDSKMHIQHGISMGQDIVSQPIFVCGPKGARSFFGAFWHIFDVYGMVYALVTAFFV